MEEKNIVKSFGNFGNPSFDSYSALIKLEERELKVSFAQISVVVENELMYPYGKVDKGKISSNEETALKQNDLRNMHFHLYLEVFFVFDDEMLLVTESQVYRFKNSVVCVPPHLNHYAVFSGKANGISIGVQEDKIGSGAMTLLPSLSLCAGNVSALPMDEDTEFYLRRIASSINEEKPNNKLKTTPLITLLVLHLFDSMNVYLSKKQRKTDAEYLKYVQEIETTLGQIYVTDVTLSTLAQRMFLSEKQVARLIKRAYGTTLSELILNKRMSVAEKLLLTTDKSISEIAKELNLKNESYFFVLFKKKYGVTPLKYRNQFKGRADF